MMLKKFLVALVAWALLANANAQVQNYIVPTAPVGTSNNQAASTAFVLSNTSQTVYSASQNGWLCDSSDHSTQALALLSTVSAAGGGEIFFPPCQPLTVSSGTYNTGTGVVSLTMPVAAALANGGTIFPFVTGIGTQQVNIVGGLLTNGTVLPLTFTDSTIGAFPVTVTYTLGAGESITSIATALKNAINGNATLAAAGISATSAIGVITITGIHSTTAVTSTLTAVLQAVVVVTIPGNSITQLSKQSSLITVSGTSVSFQGAAGLGAITITGGTIKPTYRADSQLFIPNNGAQQPAQANIAFTGSGGGQNSCDGCTNYNTGASASSSILDLRFHNVDGQSAKIETRGRGSLRIANLMLIDGSAVNTTPFVHTTNTTLTIADNTFVGTGGPQDAIVLGGTSTLYDGTLNAAFQGYGTIIRSNAFVNINHLVYGRTFANSVYVLNNTVPIHTLGSGYTGAIKFDGGYTGDGYGSIGTIACTHACSDGNYIVGNLIEMTDYKCGIEQISMQNSYIAGNSFWDPSSTQIGNYCLLGQASPPVTGGAFNIYFSAETDLNGSGAVAIYDPLGSKTSNIWIGGFGGNTATQFQVAGAVATFNLPVSNVTIPTTVHTGDLWSDGAAIHFLTGANDASIKYSQVGLLIPTVFVKTALPQSGGTTLLPFSNVAGIAVGQLVSGPNVPVGATVASLTNVSPITRAATGTTLSGQATIAFSNTASLSAGMQCTDTTAPASIGAGNVILSVQANVTITMTSNLVGNVTSGDSITCDPVVTLSAATAFANAAGAPINFYTNRIAVSSASTLYNPGDSTLMGNINSNGALNLTAAAATVAGGISYGGTTVAAGSSTCPTGTVGGQTVQGCEVRNIAGTTRYVPFF